MKKKDIFEVPLLLTQDEIACLLGITRSLWAMYTKGERGCFELINFFVMMEYRTKLWTLWKNIILDMNFISLEQTIEK